MSNDQDSSLNPSPSNSASDAPRPKGFFYTLLRWIGRVSLVFVAIVLACFVGGAIALVVAYPNLPDISSLAADYRPKQPLRIFSEDSVPIAEYGDERRNLVPITEIPQNLKNAVLAIEDARFFEHGGIDYVGVARAALANLAGSRRQGASTITMQVARNVYLTSEKTFTRKIYEALLTLKLENGLSKNQILEIYMNQIFLGNRAYGFSAAADVYFHKPLSQLSLAEAAMLAGLPQSPSNHNPIANFTKAKKRQEQVLERMVDVGFITRAQADAAKAEGIVIKRKVSTYPEGMQFVAETARQLVCAQYGDECYTRGLNVYTTVNSKEQAGAYASLRSGLEAFDAKKSWRGPEKFLDLPEDPDQAQQVAEDAFEDLLPEGDYQPAIVLAARPNKIQVMRQNGEVMSLAGDAVQRIAPGLQAQAPAQLRVSRGAVLRIAKNAAGNWKVVQTPEVEGALFALRPQTGAIRAMVGGFDFNKNHFNHAAQAVRQPGSSFKPFIYSAALEHGFTPSTVISDGPLTFGSAETGGRPWTPKNYDGGYGGPLTMRQALARSKNLVSIRILRSIGAYEGQQWATRFGFEAEKNPPYLTLALGAGGATPMQMAVAYAVFANGGHRLNPWLIAKITDPKGQLLLQVTPPALTEANRVIDERNAFVMTKLLQEVTSHGTAAAASRRLNRKDIYGKTGTTNDAVDAWFAGWQATNVAVVWMGYDKPRSLGSRETGGGLSLPIWLNYMEPLLKNVPEMEPEAPEGVSNMGGEWYYLEYPRGGGVRSVDVRTRAPAPRTQAAPAEAEAPTAAAPE
jgi:penicillin-binding protein 1A